MFTLTINDNVMNDSRLMKDLESKVKNLNSACKDYGYYGDFYIDYDRQFILVDGPIESKGEFAPIISVSNDVLKKLNITTVKVQTISYGGLTVEDYEIFYNCVEKAMHLSKELQTILDDICSII